MPLFNPKGLAAVDGYDLNSNYLQYKINAGQNFDKIITSPAPIVQYLINEASSGQVPTIIHDNMPDPVNLTITYVGADPSFTSNSGGDGIGFVSNTSTGTILSDRAQGSKLMKLHGAMQVTLQIVVNPTNLTPQQDICGLSSTGQNGVFLFYNGSELQVGFIANLFQTYVSFYSWNTGIQVLTMVIDTTLPNVADRIRLYQDTGGGATLLTPSHFDHAPQFEQIIVDNQQNCTVYFGSPIGSNKPMIGSIFYYAIYNIAMSSAQIISNSAALLINNDTVPAVEKNSEVLALAPGFNFMDNNNFSIAINTGTLSFANSNGVNFGLNGQTLTASTFGVLALSVSTQSRSSGTVLFSNSNGISFGMDTNNVMTASIGSGATATGNINAITAGNAQAGSTGTIVFSNSNNMSFGMNGNTITASFSHSVAPNAFSAGATQGTTGTIILSNSNSISFGMNAKTITASIGATSAGAISAISASNSVITSGEVVFANSNGVTFGMNNSTITMSAFSPPSSGIFAISNSNTLISAGTVVFSNSNNMSFGMNGSTITGSYAPAYQSLFEYPPGQFATGSYGTYGTGQINFVPVIFDNRVTATQAKMLFSVNVSSTNNATQPLQGTLTFAMGLYTLNVSTLSLISSASQSYSWSQTSNASTTRYNGVKELTVPLSINASFGNYWLGHYVSVSKNATQGSFGFSGVGGLGQQINSGAWGATWSSSNSLLPGFGNYSVGVTGPINSVALTDIAGQNLLFPWIALRATS